MKKIIFMGSPAFAIPTLKKLIESQHQIICVYSQPPKPSGRGYKISNTLVHQLCIEKNIDVKTPVNFKSEEAIQEFRDLNADLAVVVAYGLIIPKTLLTIPKFGFINLHPSALPKYRGAAPLQRSIMAGELSTEICVIKMDEGIDTGDIMLKSHLSLGHDINFTELQKTTSEIGADLVLNVIDNIENIIPEKQPNDNASYAHKIQKEDCIIDYQRENIFQIDCKIRALDQGPNAYTYFKEKILKIKKASILVQDHNIEPGTFILENNILQIACRSGILIPKIVQLEGKKEMLASDFLHGMNNTNSKFS